jgi:hypothetical protein
LPTPLPHFGARDENGRALQPEGRSVPTNPLKGWRVDPEAIRYAGHDLQRPECILAERDGTLWSADARGGVMQIRPDGSQALIAQKPDAHFDIARDASKSLLGGTLPNGLAFARNGDFLIANFWHRPARGHDSRRRNASADGPELGMNQPEFVTKPGERPRPTVCTASGLNGDKPSRLICQEGHQPLPGQLLTQDDLAANILAVQKEHTPWRICPPLLPRGKREGPSHQFWQ